MNSYLSRSRLSVAVVLAATLLSGCVSTGRYKADPIAVASHYGRGDATLNQPDQEQTIPATYAKHDVTQDTWWRGFGDPRLDRMVDQALKANNDLAAAGLTLRKARLQAGLSETELWPIPSASVSGSGSRSTDHHDAFDKSYDAGVSLSWEIDLWGKLRAEHDATRWEARATAEDLQNTALELISEVCNDYWDLAYLNQSINAGQKNLDRLEKTLKLVQVEFDAGNVSRLEVREAEQNLESERTSQSALLQQRVEARNAITVLLGGTPWPQQDEPQNLDTDSSPALAAGLPAELLGRRPDLRAAEMRLRESLAELKYTARSYYPSLNLTGSMSSSSTALSNVLKSPVATLGATLGLPFLNIAQARFNTKIAGTSYEIAATEFRTTLYTALSEVDNALSNREQLADQVASAQKSYDAARDIERMYEVRYRAGYTDLRTWLDAQQTLRESELSLAATRRDQLEADVTLYKALGGGTQATSNAGDTSTNTASAASH